MTQLSNVPMQPNPSATERLTLIEKLEKKATQYLQRKKDAKTLHDVRYFGGNADGLVEAINIVKQHSDWIPVSELPKEEKDWLVRFRKEDGFGLTMAVSKFYLEAQRFDCFHSKVTHYMELPKQPSEVQDAT